MVPVCRFPSFLMGVYGKRRSCAGKNREPTRSRRVSTCGWDGMAPEDLVRPPRGAVSGSDYPDGHGCGRTPVRHGETAAGAERHAADEDW
ncbi:hypothetical protein Pth03_16110 [Planotetraspora thailandica]|uniref:Uncharacterized protein n=1 Tax=Planotetraspora thailandica TaxID=487172 RepID=A0A8J3UX98_9ACTN|nr:hypothetical protein Pth03_16110 [Planotetraspora thailandica]